MREIWLPIAECEFYEVSNMGRVRSVDREFIRADGQRQGRRGVERMRAEYARGGISQRELAVRYGVGKSQVHNIISGKQWRQEWAA